jgi:PD-(D/E)XK nuclease superfamily
LLEPGRGVDKQRVTATLRRALVALLDHMREAGIQTVRTELHAEAPFKSIRLGGDIDLLLTDRLGREVVLDVKWGSEPYRAEDLRSNRQVQLAMYAYLRRAHRQWPRQAYFIVDSGRILAQEASAFPDAVLHPPANGESIEDLWRQIGITHDWRWRQLNAGRIEVNVANTSATDASIPPPGALAAAEDPDHWDDFVNLTGWADYE